MGGLAIIGAPLMLATAAHADPGGASSDTAQTSPSTDPSSTPTAPDPSASPTTPTSDPVTPSSVSPVTADPVTPPTSAAPSSVSGPAASSVVPSSSPSATPSAPSPTTVATASADPTPAPVDYVAVAWLIPGGDTSNSFAVPQTIAGHVTVDSTDPLKAEAALSGFLGCGGAYQIDVYKDDATTAALIAGGILTGPNNPAEDLATSSSYVLVTEDACLIPITIVPVTSTTPTCDLGETYTIPALPVGLKYTLNPDGTRPTAGTYPLPAGQTVTIQEHSIAGYVPVSQTFTIVGADKLAADSATCAPPVVTPPVVTPPAPPVVTPPVGHTTPPVKSTAPVALAAAKPNLPIVPAAETTSTDGSLAFTGSADTKPGLALGGGILALGGILTAIARKRRRA